MGSARIKNGKEKKRFFFWKVKSLIAFFLTISFFWVRKNSVFFLGKISYFLIYFFPRGDFTSYVFFLSCLLLLLGVLSLSKFHTPSTVRPFNYWLDKGLLLIFWGSSSKLKPPSRVESFFFVRTLKKFGWFSFYLFLFCWDNRKQQT